MRQSKSVIYNERTEEKKNCTSHRTRISTDCGFKPYGADTTKSLRVNVTSRVCPNYIRVIHLNSDQVTMTKYIMQYQHDIRAKEHIM